MGRVQLSQYACLGKLLTRPLFLEELGPADRSETLQRATSRPYILRVLGISPLANTEHCSVSGIA